MTANHLEPITSPGAPVVSPRDLPGGSRCEDGDRAPFASPSEQRSSAPAAHLPGDRLNGTHLGILVTAGSSRHLVDHVRRRFEELGVHVELVVPGNTELIFDDRTESQADHLLENKPSTDFDFVAVLPGLDTPAPLGAEIAKWAKPFRSSSRPIAIGAQAAELLGVDIDNAAVFDVSTCDAFVQICRTHASQPHP